MNFKSLFFKPKNKELANDITIKSPAKFKQSISKLKKGGINTEEKKALVLEYANYFQKKKQYI